MAWREVQHCNLRGRRLLASVYRVSLLPIWVDESKHPKVSSYDSVLWLLTDIMVLRSPAGVQSPCRRKLEIGLKGSSSLCSYQFYFKDDILITWNAEILVFMAAAQQILQNYGSFDFDRQHRERREKRKGAWKNLEQTTPKRPPFMKRRQSCVLHPGTSPSIHIS